MTCRPIVDSRPTSLAIGQTCLKYLKNVFGPIVDSLCRRELSFLCDGSSSRVPVGQSDNHYYVVISTRFVRQHARIGRNGQSEDVHG